MPYILKRNENYFNNDSCMVGLTMEESVSLCNLYNYLNNLEYNQNNLLNDIDVVFDLYDKKRNLLKSFDKVLISYINTIVTDIDQFSEVLINDDLEYFYKEYLLYSKLPLRLSRYPEADLKIARCLIGANNYYYDQLLMDYSNRNKYDNSKYRDSLYSFTYHDGIDIKTIGKTYKQSSIHEWAKSDDEIINLFNEALKAYDINENLYNRNKVLTRAVGDYAELLMFKELELTKLEGDEVIWISREIGDGFGYDILVRNDLRNETVLYEIKGTLDIKKFNNVNEMNLTNHEERVKDLAISNNVSYHKVDLCFTKDNTIIRTTNYQNNESKVYDSIKRHERTLKK